MLDVRGMRFFYLSLITLTISLPVLGAGKAGDIVSLECSRAIASALNFISKKQLKIDLEIKDGQIICVGPVNGKLHLRIQTPEMDVSTKKHYFDVDAKSFAVLKHSFSR